MATNKEKKGKGKGKRKNGAANIEYFVSSVYTKPDGEDGFHQIGAAWDHGDKIILKLRAHPVGQDIVLFKNEEYKPSKK